MQRSTSDWYLVIIVAALTALAGGAVFYLDAFSDVSSEWFRNVGLVGFGALVGMLTQKVTADPAPPAAPPAD
jgi:hypothetical protein